MHTLSAAYCLHLLARLRRHGVDDAELLANFDLGAHDFANPENRVPVARFVRLFERAMARIDDPALGIALGLEMQPTAHGWVGFASMTAGTVGEAIATAVRYAAVCTTATSLRAQLEGDYGTLVLHENADLGGAREGYVFAVLVGLWRMGCALTGGGLDVTLDFAFAEPPYFARFRDVLPPARFGQPVHQIVLRDLASLAAPLSMSDKASERTAREQCDRLRATIGLDAHFTTRVRTLLAASAEEPSLQTIAGTLHLSPRTLRRRLEAEGLTFTSLVDDERKLRALLLLRARGLSVGQVSQRLGFSDVANFSRAFRRWTGTTPRTYLDCV